MANNLQRYGFRWHSSMLDHGSPNHIRERIASGYSPSANPGAVTVDLQPGDPLKRAADGTLELAQAGEAICGILVGTAFYWDGSVMTPNNKYPAGTTYGSVLERASYVHYIPVAGQIFEVDVDEATTATTEATYLTYIGENCDHVLVPNASERRAYPMLDISTHATGTAQWRIVDIARYVNTDFSGLYTKLLVTCNEVQQSPFTTVGV